MNNKRKNNRKNDNKDNDRKSKDVRKIATSTSWLFISLIFSIFTNFCILSYLKAEEKFNEAKKLVQKEGRTQGDSERANILLSEGLKLL